MNNYILAAMCLLVLLVGVVLIVIAIACIVRKGSKDAADVKDSSSTRKETRADVQAQLEDMIQRHRAQRAREAAIGKMPDVSAKVNRGSAARGTRAASTRARSSRTTGIASATMLYDNSSSSSSSSSFGGGGGFDGGGSSSSW